MIRLVADLVRQLIDKERVEMDRLGIDHKPTIGSMYEGLSKKFLSESIPEEVDLRVVSGFIENSLSHRSGQIDVMIVTGDGISIPNTDLFIYPVQQVIAAFEIKKNMAYADMKDAFDHLSKVWDLSFEEIKKGNDTRSIDNIKIERDYATIYGELSMGFANLNKMPDEEKLCYEALIYERMQPLKIILAYGGYKSESGIRDALSNFISEVQRQKGSGYGVPAYPSLIMTEKVCVVKCNGNPYTPISNDGYWDFMASTSLNPLILLLEILWTKISNEFDIRMPWGEDLKIEALQMFLKAKPRKDAGKIGWEIAYYNHLIKSETVEYDWAPIKINEFETSLLVNLENSENGLLDLLDLSLIEFCKRSGYSSPLDALKRLIDRRIIALTKNKQYAGYVTQACAITITPAGIFAADSAQSRYSQWLIKNMQHQREA